MWEAGRGIQIPAEIAEFRSTEFLKILKYKAENINAVTIDGETIEHVERFTQLDSIIDEHGGSDADVKTRIDKAKTSFLQLNNI
ncbi:unnamed protein product [Schistosoma margrebowiei]|uniref:Uncharacterized protein n=1 Tax=Schistosoma margrebowiei TaxID=48269 RepID=A0A183MWQ7_9TREM|nr:unnamed protein product [Schistosoma margrebowiei]